MENRRLVIAMVLGLGLILLYNGVLLPWLDKKYGWDKYNAAETQPAATQASTEPASQPATIASSQPASMTVPVAATTGPTMTASMAQPAHVVPATPSPSVSFTIGSAMKGDGQFALQLNLEPLGAGIQSVVLNDFGMAEHPKELYAFQRPVRFQGDIVSMASRSITVDRTQYDLGGLEWSPITSSPTQVTYGADLVQGDKKLLEIRKSYTIYPRSSDNQGFEVRVETSFINRSDQPITIQSEFNGPVMPPAETHRAGDRETVVGFTAGSSISVAPHPIEEFKPDKDSGNIDLTKKDNQTARWAGVESNYFGAVILPEDLQANGTTGKPDYITSIVAHGINVEKEIPVDYRTAYLTFQTGPIKIEPNKSTTMPLSLFLGPKWHQIIEKPHYTDYPREYYLLINITNAMCGIPCPVQWLVAPITGLLRVMHWVFRDWGLGIIGLVAIVRTLLHPLTRQSQLSMAKMSKMGPEMKRLQEKYKDDKEALNKAMVDFHRQQGLGPYLGCLPMFLQMPIWIALYGVLQTTFELRQAPFLFNLTWIRDLSQPDYIIKFAHPLFVDWSYLPTLRGFCLLPLLMAAVMAIQQQFMPKPVAATPEQIQQQRMMQWLSPIMFLVFFYNLPSGLNLYIFTSTAIGIIESKIVRDHIRQREEAEKAGRVFVETRPTRASRQGKSPTPAAEEPMGCLGRLFAFWTHLQEQAEQARREQDRGGGKKKA
jgi:YidC/Oxa1 family membrane protein insertase